MFPIPPSEKLVETKVCKHCSIPFPVTDADLTFYEKISPVFAGKKYDIPTPTLCPDCRQQRRLSWRNRRHLYKRKCDATGKDIISMFSPDKPYKVFHVKTWESDEWDPKVFGRNFDFSKPFFDQYNELLKAVPLPHLAVIHSSLENADYVNGANSVKNSYLSNNILEVDGAYYSEGVYFSRKTIDCLVLKESEVCYECVNCHNIHNGIHLYDCKSCTNCSFCRFCTGCTDCIGCTNLVNKSYCIFNVPHSPEEYEKKKEGLTHSEITERLAELTTELPVKFMNALNSENVVGDGFVNASNCFHSFNIADSEDIKYCVSVTGNSKDCQDISFWWQQISLCYEWTAIGIDSSKILFSAETYANATECLYCFFCYPNCHHLFGCVGIKNGSYCIFNRQYTKEEYEAIVPKVIEHMRSTGEWGEFFPSRISPFGYNESLAASYFPIDRKKAIPPDSNVLIKDDVTFLQGPVFTWSDYEPPFPKVEKVIPAGKLPENIADIPDDILNWAIECEVTGKPFRIIPQELEFYREHGLSVPKRHPDQRVLDRMKLGNPWQLFERKCDQCQMAMFTTYAPERSEKIYCEKCYEKEILG